MQTRHLNGEETALVLASAAGAEDASVEDEAGAEGLTKEVEALAAKVEACLAFHFVQACL